LIRFVAVLMLLEWFIGWWCDWLTNREIDWLLDGCIRFIDCWSIDWLTRLADSLLRWDSPTDWLTDWLIDGLRESVNRSVGESQRSNESANLVNQSIDQQSINRMQPSNNQSISRFVNQSHHQPMNHSSNINTATNRINEEINLSIGQQIH
jgi:hypothetical protein